MKIDMTIEPGSRYCTYGHVGIDLDDVERRLRRHPRRVGRQVERRARRLPTCPTSVAETKLSVLSSISASLRLVALEHAAREIRRNREHAVDAAVAQIGQRLARVGVVDGLERARAGGHRAGQLADPHRRQPVILVDDPDLEVLDVAAEGVAEDAELDDRQHHRHDDQHRAAAESAQLAFDDGKRSATRN